MHYTKCDRTGSPTAPTFQSVDDAIFQIARLRLGISTLDARDIDLDFYELAVWQIKAALVDAYKAGELASANCASNEQVQISAEEKNKTPAKKAKTSNDEKPNLVIRRAQLLRQLQISNSCLYRWIQIGAFPAPIQIGPRVVAWRVADVDKWVDQQATQSKA